jgi:two-component system alkaline phosphatase synthesis response regulator PhoP
MLLDLILPVLDGLEVLRRVRQDPITAHLPVIVLSGKGEEQDKVIGLEIGADDYMTKPFAANELIARVKGRLRRSAPTDPARVLKVGSLEMELDRHQVRVRGKSVHLTSKEFSLLRALLMTNGRVLSRDALFESVWDLSKDADLQTRTIDVHIRSLRYKLGAEGRRIFTVRNVGYRLDTVLSE